MVGLARHSKFLAATSACSVFTKQPDSNVADLLPFAVVPNQKNGCVIYSADQNYHHAAGKLMKGWGRLTLVLDHWLRLWREHIFRSGFFCWYLFAIRRCAHLQCCEFQNQVEAPVQLGPKVFDSDLPNYQRRLVPDSPPPRQLQAYSERLLLHVNSLLTGRHGTI